MHNGKVPRYAVGLMRDLVYCILMQIEYQKNMLKEQTEEEYLKNIKKSIAEYEEDHGGSFEELYGHLMTHEIDERDDSMDLTIWKDLIKELRELQTKMRGELG
ncbi:hypothetical protein JJQ72_16820 [Paenibacillus sp. F411]|uniref:hypothetical protein n=1 Tax=Paenibacillus sp. F411 TaxID=2820239 RepID=UPI001AAE59B4|nr:hypothetical protein [Paenibacillus sp. F411]MBO2945643.1 hypothetical protein [Paenibacillus sp. F411]